MKRSFKVICAAILAAVAAFALVSCDSTPGTLKNQDTEFTKINYGTYAQSVVTDATLIAKLDAMDLADGERATVGSTEYEAVVAKPYRSGSKFSDGKTTIVSGTKYYFAVLPISWYVLSSEDGSVLLFAEKILDVSTFSTITDTDIGCGSIFKGYADKDGRYPNDWSISALRTFLNGKQKSENDTNSADNSADKSFVNTAFGGDPLALSAINYTHVVSKYPQSFFKNHAATIQDTDDKVFVLSYKETVDESYGFSNVDGDYDVLRMAKVSDYARAKGAYFFTPNNLDGNNYYFNGNGEYWLRTVGQDEKNAATVRYTGETGRVYRYIDTPEIGVRPAIVVGITL